MPAPKEKPFKSLDEHEDGLKKLNLSYEGLLKVAACLSADSELLLYENQEQKKLLDEFDRALFAIKTSLVTIQSGVGNAMLEMLAEADNVAAKAFIEGAKAQRKRQAIKAARSKIARDPKQAEKYFVRECWREWQSEPGRYKGKAAFARDMLNKCEHLTSHKIIENWCREWEKSEPCWLSEH